MAETPAPSSLLPRLEAAAETTADDHLRRVAAGAGGPPKRSSGRRLHDDARAMAAALQAPRRRARRPRRAARPDHRGPRHRDPGHLARRAARSSRCRCRCGWARSRSSSTQTRRRIANADAALVVVDPAARAVPRPAARRPADRPARRARAAERARRRRVPRPADDPDALAILQFTSGSHGRPEGRDAPAPVRHRQHRRHRRGRRGRPRRPTGRCRGCRCTTTWASSGCSMTPMTDGLRPRARARRRTSSPRPACWMEWISEFGGTVTGGPNFAYALAARSLRRLERPRPLAAGGSR